jgi:hypothetical protein
MDLEDADWAMNTEDELRPEYLAAAFHAIADYTLLLDAYEYSRGERFPSNRKEDVAGRYGRYMHMLGDVFDARARERTET